MARTVITRRNVGLGLAAGALAGALAACGGGGYGGGNGDGSTPPPTRSDTGTAQVDVNMTDFKLALSQKTFKAGPYTFVAENQGHELHALEIRGAGGEHHTRTLEPGESANLKVTLKSGTYRMFCPVDDHAGLGMKATLAVSGTGTSPNQNPSPSPSDGNGY